MKSLTKFIFESRYNVNVVDYLANIIRGIIDVNSDLKSRYLPAYKESNSKEFKEYLIENDFVKQMKDIRSNKNFIEPEWSKDLDDDNWVLIYGESLDKPFTIICWTWKRWKKTLVRWTHNIHITSFDQIKKYLVEPADKALENKKWEE